MKYLTVFLFMLCYNLYAQDKEGDLQLPVTDVSDIQREEEMPPTIDEVKMIQKKDDPRKDRQGKKSEKKDKKSEEKK